MTREHSHLETGATMILIAATLFLLVGVAAFAVDLSGIRLDRAVDQRVADNAASAGALAVFESGGQAGCEAALAYVDANSREIGALSDADCATSIPATCDGATTPATVTVSTGRFDVSVVYPVDDANALMLSGALGAVAQAVVADDGDQCDRLGVHIASVHDASFSQVLGVPQGATSVHAVAVATLGGGEEIPLNLLILDRTGCHTVHAKGGGSGAGGIVVGAIEDPDNPGTYYPGHGAADSDGSTCGANQGVMYKEGDPSVFRADGPPGCATDVIGTPVGEGCGRFETFATASPPVCAPPACESGPPSNPPKPVPSQMAERLTRRPVDHAFNCVSNYDPTGGLDAFYGLTIEWATAPLTATAGQDIIGCDDVSGTDTSQATVYRLVDFVGPSGAPDGTYQQWTTSFPCNVTTAQVVPAGNWWVSCNPLEVRADVVFRGNVVFDGDVTVTSSAGALTIDNTATGEGFAFLRDGTLNKDSDADLRFLDTMVYFSKTSNITMSGGVGDLRWIAPDLAGGDLENLALWSDGTLDHDWAGQAVLELEGIFFVPWAQSVYRGTGAQKQVSAQFIAKRLRAEGNGYLVLQPEIGRALETDPPIVSVLIR